MHDTAEAAQEDNTGITEAATEAIKRIEDMGIHIDAWGMPCAVAPDQPLQARAFTGPSLPKRQQVWWAKINEQRATALDQVTECRIEGASSEEPLSETDA